MNREGFAALLDQHGSQLNDWPASVTAAARSLLASDVHARELLEQQAAIEGLLADLPQPDFIGLQTRILNQPLPTRPQSAIDKLLAWLIPDNGLSVQWWRPLTAACLPLFFGIVMSNYFTFGVVSQDQGFQDWEDELVMLSLNDSSETSSLQ